ncbi:unnamed protein product [Mytilus coruscus]|uniref:Peptidase A2 domain-containing protein n=1 Tax=Mytilus coruscus TaxID=42192 RepID=A0A6J8EX24_MYTCO|nr:unnamed protein product [Mytilus coruscus]
MAQSTFLENELKNLSTLVGKLSNTIETSEKRKERQRSMSPPTGYTLGYRSSPMDKGFTPQYSSPSPLTKNFNRDRSPTQSVNLRPGWYSPNKQQSSPNRGFGQGQYVGIQYSPNRPYQNQMRSPQYREQEQNRGQYQGQFRGFTPPQYSFQRSPPQNMNARRPFYSPEKSMINLDGLHLVRKDNGQNQNFHDVTRVRQEGRCLSQEEKGQDNNVKEDLDENKKKSNHTEKVNDTVQRPEAFLNLPEILVRQTKGQNLLMPVIFNNIKIEVTVDTAAMVTLADYGMLTEQQLKKSSEKIRLKGLGSQEFEGKLIRDVTIQIGKSTVVWHKGVLNLKDNNITFADEILPLKLVNTNQGLSVSRVIVPETITVPAISIKIISVKIETSVNGDYIIEPYVVNKNILISASIGKGNLGQVHVINDSNNIVKINLGGREPECHPRGMEK